MTQHRRGWDTDVVLVVGAMRTGTTLVAELLGSHPDVDYLGFELAEEWASWTGVPWGAPGADDVACPPLDATLATDEMADRVQAGLSELLRERGRRPERPGRVVVLKSPHFWHRLPFVLALLPGARVIRTRRGLLPTVASLRRLWERSLRDHGRVHHLPLGADACWDFVPTDRASDVDPARTFPGGDVEVLAEFHRRVEDRLDAVERDRPDLVVASVDHERLVCDPSATTATLQAALGLPVRLLEPPEPLDPARCHEWRRLLDDEDLRALEVPPAPLPASGQ